MSDEIVGDRTAAGAREAVRGDRACGIEAQTRGGPECALQCRRS